MITSSPGSMRLTQQNSMPALPVPLRKVISFFVWKDHAQHRFDLLHHLHEDRIEMADERLAHGFQDGRRNITGPGPSTTAAAQQTHQEFAWREIKVRAVRASMELSEEGFARV